MDRNIVNNIVDVLGREIDNAQIKVVIAANAQTLLHYWRLGSLIVKIQKQLGWGNKVVEQISKEIKFRYPNKKGYSTRNLLYMCQFAKRYNLSVIEKLSTINFNDNSVSVENTIYITKLIDSFVITQEPPAQLQSVGNEFVISEIQFTQEPPAQIQEMFLQSPLVYVNWSCHMALLDSKLSLGICHWYIKQTLENGWSSNVLDIQIKSDLYNRQIKENKVTNFTATLPAINSDLANCLLKDPYIFDIMSIKDLSDERDIENQLVTHVTKYLLEMGDGFSFVARQKHFQIGDSDFYPDLILYNIKLHAYIVIELKATPFKPEYAGQLNFYINVVDEKLRGENDNKTIGLLLCRGKDEIVAKYALTSYSQPIGVSDYELTNAIPDNLKSSLPSIDEVEQELTQLLKDNKVKYGK